MPSLIPLLLTQALSQAVAQDPGDAVRADPNAPAYVAVVVGLSLYDNLPDEVELDFARSDAATVADTLQQLAHFPYVFLLTDREATRANVVDTLRTKAAQFLGPKDTLVVYFVGHGLGHDLGVPTLLTYDSTVENSQEDGFEVQAFAQDIATWTRAGRTILITDAIHKNQLDGIPFFGPAADTWPEIAPNTLILSASKAGQPGKDGAFGVVFADAMAGAADDNSDGRISSNELFSYLDKRLIGSGQTPAAAGALSDDFIVAESIVPGLTAVGAREDIPVITKDYEVYAAKFVFRDGAGQTVSCPGKPVKTCDPSCYVRNFNAGTCTVTSIYEGRELRGKTLALVPGRYDCGVRAGEVLSCMPPQLPVTPTPK